MPAIRFLFVVGAAYIYSCSNNERESPTNIVQTILIFDLMNNEYRFQLESRKLTGRNPRKIACPECHKKKSFVRYVDTHNNYCYLSDEVGKCDHQHSCGYHYKPSKYFKKELEEVKTAHSQIPVFVRKKKTGKTLSSVFKLL